MLVEQLNYLGARTDSVFSNLVSLVPHVLLSDHFATVSNKNSIFHNLNYFTETTATFKGLMLITVIALL